jgi:hypothetical protein
MLVEESNDDRIRFDKVASYSIKTEISQLEISCYTRLQSRLTHTLRGAHALGINIRLFDIDSHEIETDPAWPDDLAIRHRSCGILHPIEIDQ